MSLIDNTKETQKRLKRLFDNTSVTCNNCFGFCRSCTNEMVVCVQQIINDSIRQAVCEAVEREKEECAKIAYHYEHACGNISPMYCEQSIGREIADKIRTRSQEKKI